MTIYARDDVLAAMGEARAQALQRAWFLVQDTSTGRRRLTDNPEAAAKECVIRVFSPAA